MSGLEFFEISKEEKDIECWVAFPLLLDNPFEETRDFEEKIGKTTVKYRMCNTSKFDMDEEKKKIEKFNHIRFYRSEFELLLCSSGQLYFYAEKFDNGKIQKVETLSAIGRQVLITDDILLSDVFLDRTQDLYVSDNRLNEFREYIKNKHLKCEDYSFTFKDGYFEVKSGNIFVFSLTNISFDLTFPYVMYFLSSLPTEEKRFKSNCYKVQRKQIIK